MYYAGIGSRDTPDNILKIMHHVSAYLAGEGWTLRSGAALGADTAFEDGCRTAGTYFESYLPWAGYNNSKSGFNPANFPFTESESEFAERMHPAWSKCSPSARLIHKRNVRILIGLNAIHGEIVKPVQFVICWTQNGDIKGGTGQTLRMAEALEIPIINLGSATIPDELEELILNIDTLQKSLKTIKE